MVNFCNFINFQDVFPLKQKIYFKLLKNEFIKDVTIKRHREWQLLQKTTLQIYHKFSSMKLDELIQIQEHNLHQMAKITENLEPFTKFVILSPLKDVFTYFMNDESLLQGFIGRVKSDIYKKKNKIKLEYIKALEYNIKTFVDYYS